MRFGGSLHGRFLAAFYHVIRQLGVYYGDSTIFCRREAFEAVAGFPPYPLMEDMKLVSRLRRVGRMAYLDSRVACDAAGSEFYRGWFEHSRERLHSARSDVHG